MEDDRLFRFASRFAMIAALIGIFGLASSLFHTVSGNKIQQGLVPTPKAESHDILSHDK